MVKLRPYIIALDMNLSPKPPPKKPKLSSTPARRRAPLAEEAVFRARIWGLLVRFLVENVNLVKTPWVLDRVGMLNQPLHSGTWFGLWGQSNSSSQGLV